MRVAVVGGGPVGLFTGLALARQGHVVRIVERDAGPAADGTWRRRGVMQFRQPHGVRGQVVDVLRTHAPDVLDGLLVAGAVLMPVPGAPQRTATMRCRRSVFEGVLRDRAQAQPRLEIVVGHADGVLMERGRVTGVRVDGRPLAADLVVDASGCSRRGFAAPRVETEFVDCAVAYVARDYRLLPGAEPGPENGPVGMAVAYPDYWAIVFVHDRGTFSVLIAYPSADRRLRALARPTDFDAAARAIPHVAAWTDPRRARPTSSPLPGNGLRNSYRGQHRDPTGRPLPGMVTVGDAVATTTPLAGRGVALGMLQAEELLRLVDEHRGAVAEPFDVWCATNLRPWYDDHVHCDTDRLRRWSGGDVDLDRPLPSELIVAAAEADPSIGAAAGAFAAMLVLPDSLRVVEERARAVYRAGWRPARPPGPTRAELVESGPGMVRAGRAVGFWHDGESGHVRDLGLLSPPHAGARA